MKAALEPYKTADGGYGYALEPDGRGPTSQPPHIWTALEALDDVGSTDPRVPDHLETITAPDGGVPVATPDMRAVAAAPWWAIGEEGTLLATALLFAPLSKHVAHPWLGRAEAFLWDAVDAIEKTHPYEVEAAITFLDAASDRPRARGGGGAPRRARARAGPRRRSSPRATRVGEIHHPHDFASPRGQPRRARGSATPRSTPRSTCSSRARPSTAAGTSRGPSGRPRSRSSGAGW